MRSIKIIAGLLLLSGAISCQQPTNNKTILNAHISGLTDSIVEIQYIRDAQEVRDSVKVKDGKFTWTKEMPDPQEIYVMWRMSMTSFFVEKGKIDVQTFIEAPDSVIVTGSPTHNEYAALKKASEDINKRMMSIYQLSQNAGEEQAKEYQRQLDSLVSQEQKRNNEYIEQHPESYVSASLLQRKAMFGDVQEIKNLYSKLNPSIQNSQTGKNIMQRIEMMNRSAVGASVLNFSQPDTEGKIVQFSEFKGKYVLIDFWASWCGPCRAENPNVLRVYNQYKDKGFTVLGISLDDNKEKWMKAIKEDGMPWTQLSDLKGWNNEVSQFYGIKGIPSSLLVDPNGKVLAKDLRGEALQNKLAEVLQ